MIKLSHNMPLIKAKKELGQNFLKDEFALDTMVQELYASGEIPEVTVEIGPGLGALTSCLLRAGSSLLKAVEFDPRMVTYLEQKFVKEIESGKFEIIYANFLDWYPAFTLSDFCPDRFSVVGSLPYYITSPIIHKLIHGKTLPEVAVLLIQKEVAEKITSAKPDSSYLSVFVQTFFDVSYVITVDKKSFDPVPKVDGGVVRLSKRKNLQIEGTEIIRYEGFLHRCFASPRKMLNKVFTKTELEILNIDPTLRPQNFDAQDYIKIFKALRS